MQVLELSKVLTTVLCALRDWAGTYLIIIILIIPLVPTLLLLIGKINIQLIYSYYPLYLAIQLPPVSFLS